MEPACIWITYVKYASACALNYQNGTVLEQRALLPLLFILHRGLAKNEGYCFK